MQPSTAPVAKLKKPRLLVIFALQIFVLLILLLAAWLLALSELTIYSALIGAGIFIGPNAYFSFYAFRYAGARAAPQVAQSFYRGEAGKFVLTAVMFAVSFAVMRPIDVVAVFLTYIFFMVLTWLLAWRATR
ncbi:ATP synthase subunit I [Dasania sp. GY-MA-18]|uniref:ATP synthase subunit I n=1 Tax=Dasania phycosphaerae TaxID=2950436 RepID=A0A9J6RJ36_9GAMM|nr:MULTISPECIES: ATP synthase subunit I [Dasania]MCR8921974.1 ATP synthase subunit I [Dasania sp. GY-MA-18]MCZ0864402.1 ATP synthase subunit I [Dasania phycosphaerae]MCZ0868130.1 ATP synthase subunit I [Dasania phycosphaerae]